MTSNAVINANMVSKPSGISIKLSNRAEAGQTVRFLFEDIEKNAEQLRPLLANVAVYDEKGILLLDKTLRKTWNFCRQNIAYKFDPKDKEVIYSPRRIWKQKFGDCDDQTKFLLCFLHLLKIPFKIRIVGYKKAKGFAHVFPVSCLENGKEIILDYVPECNYFGHTPPYLFYRDYTKNHSIINEMETVYLDGAQGGENALSVTVQGFDDDGQPIDTGTGVAGTEDFQEAAAELGGADSADAELTNGFNQVVPLNGSIADWFKGFGQKTKNSKKANVVVQSRKKLKNGAVAKIKTYIAQTAGTLKNWTQAPQLPELSQETVKQEITALAQMQAAYENRPELVRLLKARIVANTFLKPFYLSVYSTLRHIAKTGQLKGFDEDLSAAELELTSTGDDALNGLDYDNDGLNGAEDEQYMFAGVGATDDDLTELGLRRVYTSDVLSAARRVNKVKPDKAAARTAVIAALQEGAGVLFLPLVFPKEDKQLSKSVGVKIKAAKAKKAMAELVKATGASKQEIEYAIKVGISNVYTGIVAAVNQLKADNALAGFEDDLDGADNAVYSEDLGAPKFLRRVTNKLATLVPTVANKAFNITPAGQFASFVAPNLNTKIQNLTAKDTAKAFADVRNIFSRRKAKETPQQVAMRIRAVNRNKIITALNKLNVYLSSNKLTLNDLVTPFDVKAENLKGSGVEVYEEPIASAEAEEVQNLNAADDGTKTFSERAKEFYTNNKKKIWVGVSLFVVGMILIWFFSGKKKKKKTKKRGNVNGAVGKIPTTKRKTTRKRKTTASTYPSVASKSNSRSSGKRKKKRKTTTLNKAQSSKRTTAKKGKKSKSKTAKRKK